MKRHPGILNLIIFLVFFALNAGEGLAQPPATAETDSSLYKIKTQDGSEFIGRIIEEDSTSLRMRTLAGIKIEIPLGRIKSRQRLNGEVVNGRYYYPDPNQTRLLFAPTARSLRMGQAYFSIYQIFFPMVSVGVTDMFTLSGGLSLFPAASQQLLYFSPKLHIVGSDQFDLAGGVLFLKVPFEDMGGIIYSVGSFGKPNSSLTFGLGYGFVGDKVASDPIILLGGEVRISRLAKFISENWFLPGDADFNLISLGIRFFGERLAADFALIYPAGSGIKGFPFIPWLGFAYNFGAR